MQVAFGVWTLVVWTCIIQHVQTTSLFTFQTKKMNFYDYEKCKACSRVLNIPFMDHIPKNILFVGDGTHCFAEKTSGDYDN